jgi:hypothetical protein
MFFLENIRRRSIRVLKLYRGFIITKKNILTPNKSNPPTPQSVQEGEFDIKEALLVLFCILMDKMEEKEKIMHSFGHKTIIWSQNSYFAKKQSFCQGNLRLCSG